MKNYDDFKPDQATSSWYGGNIFDILRSFPLFVKRYLINPLHVSREMKHRENFGFSVFIGFLYVLSSSLIPLGFCLNCSAVLKKIYSEEVVAPVKASVLLGFSFSIIATLAFLATTYLIAGAKGAQKPRPTEVLSVFFSNTIGVSVLQLACFGLSFLSVYVSILVFLLSLFYFGIISTIGIEALTDAMVFGRQAFITSWSISIMQATLFFVFIAFLYIILHSFRVAGTPLKDPLPTMLRYLQ